MKGNHWNTMDYGLAVLSDSSSFHYGNSHLMAITDRCCSALCDDQVPALLIVEVQRLWIEFQPDLLVHGNLADAHFFDSDCRVSPAGQNR